MATLTARGFKTEFKKYLHERWYAHIIFIISLILAGLTLFVVDKDLSLGFRIYTWSIFCAGFFVLDTLKYFIEIILQRKALGVEHG